MYPNNGQLAQRFTEESDHFMGNRSKSPSILTKLTKARQAGMGDIYGIAKAQNVPVDQVVTQIMLNSLNEINSYIMSKGETPVPDPTAACLQAVMLRAQDVGMTANILDIPDEEALEQIEQAESESINVNSPEAENVLTVPLQSAIACVMNYMSQAAPGSGKMFDIMRAVHQGAKNINNAASPVSNFSSDHNNDDGGVSDSDSDWLDFGDDDDDEDGGVGDTTSLSPVTVGSTDSGGDLSSVSVSSSLATIPGGAITGPSGSPSVAANFPSISTSASNLPVASSASSNLLANLTSGGVMNAVSSLFNVISQTGLSSIIPGLTSSTTTTNNTTGAVASTGMSTTTIIIILIIVIIIVFIIVEHH